MRMSNRYLQRRDFEDWLFFLFAWLGSVARSGGTWPDGTVREVSWGAGVAATMSWRQFLDGEDPHDPAQC